MVTEKTAFPEEKTLLDTLYAKALDSQADEPILGDNYAAEVVTKLDFDFHKTKGDRARMAGERAVTAVSAFAIPGTERLRRPYGTIFRIFAATPPLNRGVRLLRYRW
jgi:hypothetical protein